MSVPTGASPLRVPAGRRRTQGDGPRTGLTPASGASPGQRHGGRRLRHRARPRCLGSGEPEESGPATGAARCLRNGREPRNHAVAWNGRPMVLRGAVRGRTMAPSTSRPAPPPVRGLGRHRRVVEVEMHPVEQPALAAVAFEQRLLVGERAPVDLGRVEERLRLPPPELEDVPVRPASGEVVALLGVARETEQLRFTALVMDELPLVPAQHNDGLENHSPGHCT